MQWDNIYNVYIHRDLEAEGISVASIGLDRNTVIVTVDTDDVDDAFDIIEELLVELGVVLYDYEIEYDDFLSRIYLEI